MKLKCRFELMEMEDEIVAVPIEEGTHMMNCVIKLNETAADIFKAFQEETTEEAVLETLITKYSKSEKKEIEEYLHEYISELKKQGLLV